MCGEPCQLESAQEHKAVRQDEPPLGTPAAFPRMWCVSPSCWHPRHTVHSNSFTPCDSWPYPPVSNRAALGAGCRLTTTTAPRFGTKKSGPRKKRCAGMSVRSGSRSFSRCWSPYRRHRKCNSTSSPKRAGWTTSRKFGGKTGRSQPGSRVSRPLPPPRQTDAGYGIPGFLHDAGYFIASNAVSWQRDAPPTRIPRTLYVRSDAHSVVWYGCCSANWT
jgi:hypothetical protein